MPNKPFFSILLPTKNRSHIIATAIQSVLIQSFHVFELIIADNDDDPRATKIVVHSFVDERIKYIRTGGLYMVDNWEAARSYANGQYMLVLEDKLAYFHNALATLHGIILRSAAEVLSFKMNAPRKLIKYYENKPVSPESFSSISSSLLLKAYLSQKPKLKGYRLSHLIPRSTNSCISIDLISKILNRTGSDNYFSLYSPDFTAAFKQLFCVDTIYYTKARLGYFSSNDSNGRLLTNDKIASQKYFSGNSIGTDLSVATRYVPIKCPDIISNLIYNDYLMVKNQYGIADLYTDNCTYAFMCYKELVLRHKDKNILQKELDPIYSYVNSTLTHNEKRCFNKKVLLSKIFGLKLIH